MQVEVFSLCDAATDTVGKLNILGAFDMIWVQKTPTVYPQCSVAIRLRFERIECGEHRIQVHFIDRDGRNVIPPLENRIHVRMLDGQMSTSANLILNIQRLKFDKPGEYSIDLAIDGQQKLSLPLFIKEHSQPDVHVPPAITP